MGLFNRLRRNSGIMDYNSLNEAAYKDEDGEISFTDDLEGAIIVKVKDGSEEYEELLDVLNNAPNNISRFLSDLIDDKEDRTIVPVINGSILKDLDDYLADKGFETDYDAYFGTATSEEDMYMEAERWNPDELPKTKAEEMENKDMSEDYDLDGYLDRAADDWMRDDEEYDEDEEEYDQDEDEFGYERYRDDMMEADAEMDLYEKYIKKVDEMSCKSDMDESSESAVIKTAIERAKKLAGSDTQKAMYIRGYKDGYMANNSMDEEKADKDYDGDGEIESGTEEYMGSRDKAIKKSMKSEAEDIDGVDADPDGEDDLGFLDGVEVELMDSEPLPFDEQVDYEDMPKYKHTRKKAEKEGDFDTVSYYKKQPKSDSKDGKAKYKKIKSGEVKEGVEDVSEETMKVIVSIAKTAKETADRIRKSGSKDAGSLGILNKALQDVLSFKLSRLSKDTVDEFADLAEKAAEALKDTFEDGSQGAMPINIKHRVYSGMYELIEKLRDTNRKSMNESKSSMKNLLQRRAGITKRRLF